MTEDPLPVQFLFDKDVREHVKTCSQCTSIQDGIIKDSEKQNIGRVDIAGFTRFLLQTKNLDGIKLVIKHTRENAT